MIKRYPYILLFGIALSGAFKVEGQATMPDNVCIGQLRRYNVYSNPGSTYTWWIDGIVQAGFTTNEFVHTWNNSSTYLLEVQERSPDGCLGPIRSGQVFVNPLPSLAATGINPVAGSDDGKIDFTFINVPDGTCTISYSTGNFTDVTVADGIATVTAPEGIYNNLSITIDGCTSETSVNVIITGPDQTSLIIPEAFSPNSDLINDVWNIGNIEAYPKAEIVIYNRWGQSVWRSKKGYPQPWDGKSNGVNLPVDSYHYVIDLHNGSKQIVGFITIVK